MLVLFFSVHSTVKEGIMRLWSSGESFSPSASFSIHSIDMFVKYLSHGFRIGSIKSNFPFFFLFLFRREWEREERASRWWRKIEGWQSTYRRIIFFPLLVSEPAQGYAAPPFSFRFFFLLLWACINRWKEERLVSVGAGQKVISIQKWPRGVSITPPPPKKKSRSVGTHRKKVYV